MRMPHVSGVCLVALALAGCAGAPVPTTVPPPTVQALPAAAQTWDTASGWVSMPAVPASAPTKRWSVPIPAGATAAVGETGVCVLAANGRVQRLDLATGTPAWSVPVPAGELSIVGATSPVVVATAGDAVTVLDARDGRTLWSGPRADGKLVTATDDALLVGNATSTALVDRTTGAQRWRVPLDVTMRDGTLVFEGLGRSTTTTTPDGVVDPATGRPIWQVEDPLFTDLNAVDGLVVRTIDVEPGSDTATAFDAATGAQRWSVDLDGIGRAEVQPLTDDTLLVTGGGAIGLGSVAVRASDGSVRWRADRGLNTVLRMDGAPYAVRYDTYQLSVADGRTGKLRDAATPGFAKIAGGAAYSPSDTAVVAIGLRDLVEHWRVPDVGYAYGLTAVPGGFVVIVGKDEPRQLTAYLS